MASILASLHLPRFPPTDLVWCSILLQSSTAHNLTDCCGFKTSDKSNIQQLPTTIKPKGDGAMSWNPPTFTRGSGHNVGESTWRYEAESTLRKPPDSTNELSLKDLTSQKYRNDSGEDTFRACWVSSAIIPKSKLLITLCAFRSASAKDFPTSLRWESTATRQWPGQWTMEKR